MFVHRINRGMHILALCCFLILRGASSLMGFEPVLSTQRTIPQFQYVITCDEKALFSVLSNIFSRSSCKISESSERVLELYFDTPELLYHESDGFVYYEAREYFSKTGGKAKYNERIHCSINGKDIRTYEARQYNTVSGQEEKHPLLRLVHRGVRPEFFKNVKDHGVHFPMRFKAVLQASAVIHSFNIICNDGKSALIEVHDVELASFGSSSSYILLRVFTSEMGTDRLQEDRLAFSELIKELKRNSSSLSQNQIVVPQETRYHISFEKMKEDTTFFLWKLRYPWLVRTIYGGMYGLIGWGLILLFCHRRLRLRPVN